MEKKEEKTSAVVGEVRSKSTPVSNLSSNMRHKLVEPTTTIDEFFLDHDAISVEKYRLRKKLGMTVIKNARPEKPSLYDELKVSIIKAGMNMDPVVLLRSMFKASILVDIFFTLVLLVMGFSYSFSWWKVILASIVAFGVLLLVIYPIIYLIFRLVLHYRMFRRKMEIEEILPDFLRLVASNYRSGLPLDKALTKSNRARFGVFNKEVELMAKTTKIKGDLSIALEIFGKKFESKILERAMNSISMSVKSGSNVSPLLEEIASNINKMRNMRASMAANVKNYIIFIIIAAVIIAPLMYGMSFAMNTTINSIKNSMTSNNDVATPGPLSSISFEGGILPADFDIFATMMLLTTSIVSALVISMIKNGNVQQGIRNIPIFLLITNVLYYVGKAAVMSMLNVI